MIIMFLLILLVGISSAICNYIIKHMIKSNPTKAEYTFWACLALLPFSLSVILLQPFLSQLPFNEASLLFEPLKFDFSWWVLLLIAISAVIRILNLTSIVTVMTHLDPHEAMSYGTFAIIITYFIDVAIGKASFKWVSFLTLFLILAGVMLIHNKKINMKALFLGLCINILTQVIYGYLVYYILKYWSNALYMFLVNLVAVVVLIIAALFKGHTIDSLKSHKNFIGWMFAAQTMAFFMLYISNFLNTKAVTLMMLTNPMKIVMGLILGFFIIKDMERKPSWKDGLAVAMISVGVLFLKL